MNILTMSAKFKTKFNTEWLTDVAISSWLQPVTADPYRARCSLCCKTFDLSNMGRQVVLSHKVGLRMEPVIMLHQIGLCNYARSVELYLMLIYIVVIQSVIVWKIFCIGSGKLREFHIANFVSTL
jgi:hypothetical protein